MRGHAFARNQINKICDWARPVALIYVTVFLLVGGALLIKWSLLIFYGTLNLIFHI